MTSVLVLSPEPIRAEMAGMGIRAARIADVLTKAGHIVTLADPATRDLPRADVAVVSGHAGERLFSSGFDGAVVADLYDPFVVENLAYRTSLGPAVFENDRRALLSLIDRADLVLAATDEQRLFYLGLLLGRERLTPEALDSLVVLAPFGVDDEAPGPPVAPREIGPGSHDVLFGGVYDWYDPALVLDAWPRVLSRVPTARLLFSTNPNPGSTPQARLAETTARASAEGLLGTSVHVIPWVKHAERGGLYASCRVAVLAHRDSLETRLSFRTRVLDFLWAGLPVAATEGGAASHLVERSGAGLVVPADPERLASALVKLLVEDSVRARCIESAARAVKEFAWRRVLAPLVDFVASPRRHPARSLRRRRFRDLLGRRG